MREVFAGCCLRRYLITIAGCDARDAEDIGVKGGGFRAVVVRVQVVNCGGKCCLWRGSERGV